MAVQDRFPYLRNLNSYLRNLNSLGSRSAVVDILGLRLHGRLAACVWRLLYVGKRIGFRNKM